MIQNYTWHLLHSWFKRNQIMHALTSEVRYISIFWVQNAHKTVSSPSIKKAFRTSLQQHLWHWNPPVGYLYHVTMTNLMQSDKFSYLGIWGCQIQWFYSHLAIHCRYVNRTRHSLVNSNHSLGKHITALRVRIVVSPLPTTPTAYSWHFPHVCHFSWPKSYILQLWLWWEISVLRLILSTSNLWLDGL